MRIWGGSPAERVCREWWSKFDKHVAGWCGCWPIMKIIIIRSTTFIHYIMHGQKHDTWSTDTLRGKWPESQFEPNWGHIRRWFLSNNLTTSEAVSVQEICHRLPFLGGQALSITDLPCIKYYYLDRPSLTRTLCLWIYSWWHQQPLIGKIVQLFL